MINYTGVELVSIYILIWSSFWSIWTTKLEPNEHSYQSDGFGLESVHGLKLSEFKSQERVRCLTNRFPTTSSPPPVTCSIHQSINSSRENPLRYLRIAPSSAFHD